MSHLPNAARDAQVTEHQTARATANTNRAIETMREAVEDAQRRAARADTPADAIREVMSCFAQSWASAATSLASAMDAVRTIAEVNELTLREADELIGTLKEPCPF